MKTMSLNLKALYEKNGTSTRYGHSVEYYKDNNNEHYDLKTKGFDLVGHNGEIFDVVEIDEENNKVRLVNHDGIEDMIIILSFDEYAICRWY